MTDAQHINMGGLYSIASFLVSSTHCEERLKKLDLSLLAYIRSTGDLVETFQIVNGVHDKDICESLFKMKQELETRERNYSSKDRKVFLL